eukprot:TRINITY_DN31853_c0_g1_i1.p1 TRINITY_DN31853_c0_g1~~TRINITY_DN31853_c0_g1_i1.p1  ORF type:complete len:376 (-),score=78.75 TRINITY_DN31853_c0_g1_i1:59-1186(-)
MEPAFVHPTETGVHRKKQLPELRLPCAASHFRLSQPLSSAEADAGLGGLAVLPPEIVLSILVLLTWTELLMLTSISRAMLAIASDAVLWRDQYFRTAWLCLDSQRATMVANPYLSPAACCWKRQFVRRMSSPGEVNARLHQQLSELKMQRRLLKLNRDRLVRIRQRRPLATIQALDMLNYALSVLFVPLIWLCLEHWCMPRVRSFQLDTYVLLYHGGVRVLLFVEQLFIWLSVVAAPLHSVPSLCYLLTLTEWAVSFLGSFLLDLLRGGLYNGLHAVYYLNVVAEYFFGSVFMFAVMRLWAATYFDWYGRQLDQIGTTVSNEFSAAFKQSDALVASVKRRLDCPPTLKTAPSPQPELNPFALWRYVPRWRRSKLQ